MSTGKSYLRMYTYNSSVISTSRLTGGNGSHNTEEGGAVEIIKSEDLINGDAAYNQVLHVVRGALASNGENLYYINQQGHATGNDPRANESSYPSKLTTTLSILQRAILRLNTYAEIHTYVASPTLPGTEPPENLQDTFNKLLINIAATHKNANQQEAINQETANLYSLPSYADRQKNILKIKIQNNEPLQNKQDFEMVMKACSERTYGSLSADNVDIYKSALIKLNHYKEANKKHFSLPEAELLSQLGNTYYTDLHNIIPDTRGRIQYYIPISSEYTNKLNAGEFNIETNSSFRIVMQYCEETLFGDTAQTNIPLTRIKNGLTSLNKSINSRTITPGLIESHTNLQLDYRVAIDKRRDKSGLDIDLSPKEKQKAEEIITADELNNATRIRDSVLVKKYCEEALSEDAINKLLSPLKTRGQDLAASNTVAQRSQVQKNLRFIKKGIDLVGEASNKELLAKFNRTVIEINKKQNGLLDENFFQEMGIDNTRHTTNKTKRVVMNGEDIQFSRQNSERSESERSDSERSDSERSDSEGNIELNSVPNDSKIIRSNASSNKTSTALSGFNRLFGATKEQPEEKPDLMRHSAIRGLINHYRDISQSVNGTLQKLKEDEPEKFERFAQRVIGKKGTIDGSETTMAMLTEGGIEGLINKITEIAYMRDEEFKRAKQVKRQEMQVYAKPQGATKEQPEEKPDLMRHSAILGLINHYREMSQTVNETLQELQGDQPKKFERFAQRVIGKKGTIDGSATTMAMLTEGGREGLINKITEIANMRDEEFKRAKQAKQQKMKIKAKDATEEKYTTSNPKSSYLSSMSSLLVTKKPNADNQDPNNFLETTLYKQYRKLENIITSLQTNEDTLSLNNFTKRIVGKNGTGSDAALQMLNAGGENYLLQNVSVMAQMSDPEWAAAKSAWKAEHTGKESGEKLVIPESVVEARREHPELKKLRLNGIVNNKDIETLGDNDLVAKLKARDRGKNHTYVYDISIGVEKAPNTEKKASTTSKLGGLFRSVTGKAKSTSSELEDSDSLPTKSVTSGPVRTGVWSSYYKYETIHLETRSIRNHKDSFFIEPTEERDVSAHRQNSIVLDKKKSPPAHSSSLGASQITGYSGIRNLSNGSDSDDEVETLLQNIRSGAISRTPRISDSISAASDRRTNYTNGMDSYQERPQHMTMVERIAQKASKRSGGGGRGRGGDGRREINLQQEKDSDNEN